MSSIVDLKEEIKTVKKDIELLEQDCVHWKSQAEDLEAAVRVLCRQHTQEIAAAGGVDHTICDKCIAELRVQLNVFKSVRALGNCKVDMALNVRKVSPRCDGSKDYDSSCRSSFSFRTRRYTELLEKGSAPTFPVPMSVLQHQWCH